MNIAKNLKRTLTDLFRSGADMEHDVWDMTGLLDGIDFHALLQALCNKAVSVREYTTYGETDDIHYCGRMLFPSKAVLLYEDAKRYTNQTALCCRSLELWLLQDMILAVASCYSVDIGNGRYVTQYRTHKGSDWKEAGMGIDFLKLADDLETLCYQYNDEDCPLYEL